MKIGADMPREPDEDKTRTMAAACDHEGWPADTELVQALVRRAVCCPCPHPTRIAITYERNADSERRGRDLIERLRLSRHDILVAMEPGDADRLRRTGRHSCVVLDARDGTMS